MQVLLAQLRAAARRLEDAGEDVARLRDRAFAAGATNRQIADATGSTVEAVRMRRRRRGGTA